MVYSLGEPERGSLLFLLPKLPVHKTVSFKITMADRAGRLIGLTLCRSKASTWKETEQEVRGGYNEMPYIINCFL